MANTDFDTEAMSSGEPLATPALELGRQTLQPELRKVGSAQDYEAVPYGSAYLDPQGQKRFKPIRNKEDWLAVPEGGEYADPTGQIRSKPKYEGIDFSPQALYDIAHSDKGRRMALEKFYPGKVFEDPAGGFYIEDEGKFRKPGRGLKAAGAFVATEAIPTVLAGGGSLIGGAVGTLAEPGGGTVVGGAAGGYGGGYMGQRINDIFAQLAGVYDPEGGEANARMAGYAGAAGDVGGRAVMAAAPAAKEILGLGRRGAAKTVNKFLGTSSEGLETALPIAESGEKPGTGLLGMLGMSTTDTQVPPSAIFKASPHTAENVATTFAQKFDKTDNYMANAERFMDKRAKDILASKDIGAIVQDSLVHPKAAVAAEEAGEALKESARLRALDQSQAADAELQRVLAARRGEVEARHAGNIEDVRARRENVVKAAEDAKAAADNLVEQGFKAIEKQADDAIRVAKVGHNAGDLWRTVAESFVQLRRSIGQRANQMYTDAETASGGLVPPGSNGLAQPARQLIAELPDNFESLHPSIVKKLRDIAGVQDPETGEWIKEPADATWVQLHNLRSQIRQDIKWNDLPSDIRNGTLKFLDRNISEILHSVENQPELQEASRLLRLADEFYRENMGPLNDAQIKSLVKALDSGLQADPKALLKVAMRDGRTEVANTIRNTVGPQTWDAMRAADVKEMLAQSKTLAEDGAIDGLSFAKQVLDRDQNGVLEVLHGREGADRLRAQARYVQQLRGKLPIKPRPGDTANDIILRARAAVADAEKLAKEDPLKAMANEMKRVEAAARKEFMATRKPDPLAFLTNSTVGANAAVDKILGDPDLIVAASRAFPGGEKSKEFQLMRQVWVERILRETLEPGERLAKVSPEIQALMFPGVTLSDMQMLAKEMKLLRSAPGVDFGSSLAAGEKVENPIGALSKMGKLIAPLGAVPILGPMTEAGARGILTAYYNTVRGLLTSPSTLRWLRKGLQSRDPMARETARAELRAALQRGGAMGAIGVEAAYQGQE